MYECNNYDYCIEQYKKNCPSKSLFLTYIKKGQFINSLWERLIIIFVLSPSKIPKKCLASTVQSIVYSDLFILFPILLRSHIRKFFFIHCRLPNKKNHWRRCCFTLAAAWFYRNINQSNLLTTRLIYWIQ